MTSTAPWALRTHTPFRPWRFTKHTLAAVSVSVLALAALSPHRTRCAWAAEPHRRP